MKKEKSSHKFLNGRMISSIDFLNTNNKVETTRKMKFYDAMTAAKPILLYDKIIEDEHLERRKQNLRKLQKKIFLDELKKNWEATNNFSSNINNNVDNIETCKLKGILIKKLLIITI